MRKRKPVVVAVSSSSEEDEGRASRPPARPRRSSRTASAPRKKPRGGAPRRANSASREADAVKFEMLSEDFCECLEDIHIAPGFQSKGGKELWVDKYNPRSLEELAVHKKKVEEVKKWVADRLKMPKEDLAGNCTLFITGQAGVGKSASIHVIASELGVELCEWITPTPTLWQEHQHSSSLGLRYMSKLDEFENFVQKTSKYSLLLPLSHGEPRRPVVLLIDDLPATNGRAAFLRLSKCLTTLVHSTKVPTVILLTECHKTEFSDSSTHCYEELETSLSRAGAYKVTFNPITVNSMKKTLARICQVEKYDVTTGVIDCIAKTSGGDVRHAITSLQYCCLRPDRCSSFHVPLNTPEMRSKHSTSLSFPRVTEHEDNDALAFPSSRDKTLTLYHALGKFLHNKREISGQPVLGSDQILLKDSFTRNPLKMDAPEQILSQANGQAGPITEFLHENVLDFICDEAIDDAWLVISYLCEADCLLSNTLSSRRPWLVAEKFELDGITQTVAASVAARGVLFGNSHPAQSGWHTIRSPRLWQIEQSMRVNKNQMQKEALETFSCNILDMATEYRPRINWLGFQTSKDNHAQENYDDKFESDASTEQGPLVESEEDEIEDC